MRSPVTGPCHRRVDAEGVGRSRGERRRRDTQTTFCVWCFRSTEAPTALVRITGARTTSVVTCGRRLYVSLGCILPIVARAQDLLLGLCVSTVGLSVTITDSWTTATGTSAPKVKMINLEDQWDILSRR